MIDQINLELDKKKVNIARLKEHISGMNSTAHSSAGDDKNESEQQPETSSSPDNKKASNANGTSEKPKGHGRHGVDDYPGAKRVACQHESHKAGDTCPLCHQGVLRQEPPKIRIQIDGGPPLTGTRYELEKLTCTLCPFTTTAQAPVDLTQKYTEKAKATLAYLHYGMGLPYYRLAKMQDMLGVPIAVSTQSELMAAMMGPIHGLFNHLVVFAAQSDCLYQDDTGVRIQSLIKENKNTQPQRKGMFTSGFIAEGEHKVVLYFSGRAHAGENFDTIINHRQENKGQVIRMADALSANSKHAASAIEAKCNAHAFRRFRSLLSTYPEAAHYVLDIYDKVYDIDKVCKAQKMDAQARLRYHQRHSRPLMDKLETWVNEVLSSGEVEPNSVLAAECPYF
jgi:transposase